MCYNTRFDGKELHPCLKTHSLRIVKGCLYKDTDGLQRRPTSMKEKPVGGNLNGPGGGISRFSMGMGSSSSNGHIGILPNPGNGVKMHHLRFWVSASTWSSSSRLGKYTVGYLSPQTFSLFFPRDNGGEVDDTHSSSAAAAAAMSISSEKACSFEDGSSALKNKLVDTKSGLTPSKTSLPLDQSASSEESSGSIPVGVNTNGPGSNELSAF